LAKIETVLIQGYFGGEFGGYTILKSRDAELIKINELMNCRCGVKVPFG
jgi:hypothetical protein